MAPNDDQRRIDGQQPQQRHGGEVAAADPRSVRERFEVEQPLREPGQRTDQVQGDERHQHAPRHRREPRRETEQCRPSPRTAARRRAAARPRCRRRRPACRRHRRPRCRRRVRPPRRRPASPPRTRPARSPNGLPANEFGKPHRPASSRPVGRTLPGAAAASARSANAAATMPIMVNATAMKACSSALVPPIRATMSRATALSPSSSPMPCTTLPISRPYRHRPTVHSSSAPRSSRHASPKTLRSAGRGGAGTGAFGDQPGADVAAGEQPVGHHGEHGRRRQMQQQHPPVIAGVRPDLQRPAQRREPRQRAGAGVADGAQRERGAPARRTRRRGRTGRSATAARPPRPRR